MTPLQSDSATLHDLITNIWSSLPLGKLSLHSFLCFLPDPHMDVTITAISFLFTEPTVELDYNKDTVPNILDQKTSLYPFTGQQVWAAAESLSHVRLFCNPMDGSLPRSSDHGISQARIVEWAAMPTSRGSSWPGDGTCVSCIGRRTLYH